MKTDELKNIGNGLRHYMLWWLGLDVENDESIHWVVKFCDICSLIYEINNSGYEHVDMPALVNDLVKPTLKLLHEFDIPFMALEHTMKWVGIDDGAVSELLATRGYTHGP